MTLYDVISETDDYKTKFIETGKSYILRTIESILTLQRLNINNPRIYCKNRNKIDDICEEIGKTISEIDKLDTEEEIMNGIKLVDELGLKVTHLINDAYKTDK